MHHVFQFASLSSTLSRLVFGKVATQVATLFVINVIYSSKETQGLFLSIEKHNRQQSVAEPGYTAAFKAAEIFSSA